MDKGYLNLLIGRRVIKINTSLNTVYPIDEVDESKIISIVTTVIHFDGEYSLVIDNPHEVASKEETIELNNLVDKWIISVIEEEHIRKLFFQDDITLTIDLRDEAYYGPEALSLSGPNDLSVVWN